MLYCLQSKAFKKGLNKTRVVFSLERLYNRQKYYLLTFCLLQIILFNALVTYFPRLLFANKIFSDRDNIFVTWDLKDN